jgi:hypothetical protein
MLISGAPVSALPVGAECTASASPTCAEAVNAFGRDAVGEAAPALGTGAMPPNSAAVCVPAFAAIALSLAATPFMLAERSMRRLSGLWVPQGSLQGAST